MRPNPYYSRTERVMPIHELIDKRPTATRIYAARRANIAPP